MKRVFVCLFLLFFMNTIHVFSQESDSLEQLKHQIRELEKIDRDENVSFDVKQINATFLDDRRATLRKTLETRINSAQQYLFRVGSQLSNAEIQAVEQNIAAWRKELALQTEGSPAPREADASQPLSQPPLRHSETALNVMPASAPAPPPPPQSQNKPIQSAPIPLSPAGAALIRQPVAEIINPSAADQLIDAAFSAQAFKDAGDNPIPRPAEIDRNDFHCVIHVVRWSDPDAANKQTVVAQNWYVYNNGKAKGLRSDRIWSQEDFTGDRIYGVKKIWLLYVHLNTKVSYSTYYDFRFTKKTPANISNLLALAQVFTIIPGGGPAPAPMALNVWGGSFVETDYVPSDATITANISPNPGTYVALDKPKKFDNEGLYWWDVSIGVPIRKIKELQFDSTANTVTAKEVDQQNAFALLNLYFPPKDIKGTTSSWIPHFIGGVAIAKQPLKKFMFGAGFGPNFTNFYVGALFTEQKRPSTLTEGSTATPDQLNNDLKRHFKAQFTFGINIPVRAVLATLEKKKE